MQLNYKNIFLIIIFSSVVGFVYNAINPKGIPVIKEERILSFEEEIELPDSIQQLISDSETKPAENLTELKSENSLIKEEVPVTHKPFDRPIAIKLSRAYQLFNQGTIFIDSRSKEEFDEGHIKNAINIPFYDSEKYENILNKISTDKIIVTYCSSKECDTSILHGDELFEKGYKRVYIFQGGWDDWLQAGYPIESSN